MKRRLGLRIATGVGCIIALAMTGGAPAIGRGSASGIYTAQQAAEGGRIYAVQCAMCHGKNLAGTVETPGLTGKFVAEWGGRPVSHLFAYIGRAMPQHAPGSLSPQDSARLVAFILQANGAPPGTRILPDEARALAKLDFDAPGPPE